MNKFEALAWLDRRSFVRVRSSFCAIDDIEVRGVPVADIPEQVLAHLRVLARGPLREDAEIVDPPCWYDEDDRTWCILDSGHDAAKRAAS